LNDVKQRRELMQRLSAHCLVCWFSLVRRLRRYSDGEVAMIRPAIG